MKIKEFAGKAKLKNNEKNQCRADILNTIGHTPLVKIENIYAKLETINPSGSVKDRMAWYMVVRAEERGELKQGGKIIEVTSGQYGNIFCDDFRDKGLSVYRGNAGINEHRKTKDNEGIWGKNYFNFGQRRYGRGGNKVSRTGKEK